MTVINLTFLAPAVLAVQLAPALPVLSLSMVAPVALPVALQQSPVMQLRFRAPQALDAALLPILIGPPATGDASAPPVSRTLTWSSGRLSGVAYADGRSKALTWDAGRLTRVDRLQPSQPTRRADLAYNTDGTLASVTESVL